MNAKGWCIMTLFRKMNLFQIIGLIISITGLLFMAFPSFIGTLAIRVITFIFLMIGFYSFTFALVSGSKLSIIASAAVLILSFYAFIRPENVLMIIGLGCIISGTNGMIMFFKTRGEGKEKAVISSIILILLGVFAVINSKAALATVVMILGIMITIIGLVVFFLGKTLIIRKQKAFFKSHAYSGPRGRVIINIDSDDVEEIDYKEIK